MRYEPGCYIPEDGILHSHVLENLKSYIALIGWTLYRRRNVSPVRYEPGFYIPEDGILHEDRREHLKSHMFLRLTPTYHHASNCRHTYGRPTRDRNGLCLK
jgi:hypothetical protein